MRLFVLGATGRTGIELLELALERHHQARAFVRSPERIARRSPELAIVKGNVFDADAIAAALPGHDALISALGPAHRASSRFVATETVAIRRTLQPRWRTGSAWWPFGPLHRHEMSAQIVAALRVGRRGRNANARWGGPAVVLPAWPRTVFRGGVAGPPFEGLVEGRGVVISDEVGDFVDTDVLSLQVDEGKIATNLLEQPAVGYALLTEPTPKCAWTHVKAGRNGVHARVPVGERLAHERLGSLDQRRL